MAVEIIAGVLGGGKTYYGVTRMLEHFARGGTVVSNITLELEPWWNTRYDKQEKGLKWTLYNRYKWELQDEQIIHIDNEQLGEIEKHVPWGELDCRVLVVIDEALDYFDSLDRGEAQASRKRFFAWIRRVRKFNIDICFVTQVHGQLNNRLRGLAAVVWAVEDMAEWRAPGLGWPFPFPWMFRRRRVLPDGKTIIKAEYDVKDFHIFGCYRTEEVFDGWKPPKVVGRLTSGKLTAVGDWPMKWKIAIVMLAVAIVVVAIRGHRGVDLAGVYGQLDELREEQEATMEVVKQQSAGETEIPIAKARILHLSLMNDRVFCAGREIRTGDVLEVGIVLGVDARKVTVQRWNGDILSVIPGTKSLFYGPFKEIEVKDEISHLTMTSARG